MAEIYEKCTYINYDDLFKKMPTFCERFNEICGNLTNIEVAKLTGLSSRSVWRWRCGDYLPRTIELKRICQTFNVSADWLLGLTDERRTLNG